MQIHVKMGGIVLTAHLDLIAIVVQIILEKHVRLWCGGHQLAVILLLTARMEGHV